MDPTYPNTTSVLIAECEKLAAELIPLVPSDFVVGNFSAAVGWIFFEECVCKRFGVTVDLGSTVYNITADIAHHDNVVLFKVFHEADLSHDYEGTMYDAICSYGEVQCFNYFVANVSATNCMSDKGSIPDMMAENCTDELLIVFIDKFIQLVFFKSTDSVDPDDRIIPTDFFYARISVLSTCTSWLPKDIVRTQSKL